MSSSDDDVPLSGIKRRPNGIAAASPPVSAATIPASLDKKLDRQNPSDGHDLHPGISIRNGPLADDSARHDVAGPAASGSVPAKRKVRESAAKPKYTEQESSDDDVPLVKKRKTVSPAKPTAADSDSDVPLAKAKAQRPSQASAAPRDQDSDSDVPVRKKLVQTKQKMEQQADKTAKAMRSEEKKAAAAKPAKKAEKKAAPAKRAKKDESSDDDVPLKKKAAAKATKVKKEEASPKIKKEEASSKVKKEEASSKVKKEEASWWEDPTKGDGTNKWETLQHNGVLFPPAYEPLPKNVKMKYDGVPVTLEPEAEEVAGFFGSMLNSAHNVENPTFQKNFFHDFKQVLKKTGGAKDKNGAKVDVQEFAKCDFRPLFDYYDAQREAKKVLPKEEKRRLKAEKDAAEEKYMFCVWDGRKQKVGNFRVEPPGLFRGRGEHPKTGHVKNRVQPEQITLNIGKEATVPPPPEGHRWKEIKHDKQGTWLAMWQENINGNYKYVMLAANSDVKGQSDYKKFEKARELKKHIDRIRQDYSKNLKNAVTAERQLATAMYLIDKFALRAGNEKGEDEADTVGCCSLKFEHITLKEPSTVVFDFLGKDSIRFHEEFEVDAQVFKNLRIFKRPPKKEGDDIFDRLTTTQLNKHLKDYMDGLTAKVFRTYNASWTMAQLLKSMKSEGTVPERVKDYNDANRQVAILCNHKRTVAASHEGAMQKMEDRIKGVIYQQWRTKQMMLDLDPKMKKKKGADYFELPDVLDEAWILDHQDFLINEQRAKIEKKFEKDNEKLKADGEKEMKHKELQDRLNAEGRSASVEKLEAQVEKMDTRIATMRLQAQDRESNKEVALGTSKINYIDPRLTVVFAKKFNVPIEKFFSKTLREKFEWAIKSVDENWEF
ncbi:hypothetical protein DV737_g4042, partial [Chaetothyriales sp. CBS 132003]